MSHTIYAGKIAKRKNSTLQPTLIASFDVLLKTPTSLHTPTFTINAATFDYNYLKWGDRYYFVTDVTSRNNNLWEVSAVVDVLATFKADILASTQFVSYSSLSGGTWLADTRIPIMKNATVAQAGSTMNFLFTTAGFYVLSVVGKNGCELWMCDIGHLHDLLDKITDWSDDLIDDVLNGRYPWTGGTAATYDFSSPEGAIESMAKMNALTGFAGNAYTDAPNCIRSCIWVPFFASFFTNGSGEIYLGQFPTGVSTFKCTSNPVSRNVTVSIPWHYSDWRRAVCEEVYLYLPLVGMVNIPSDEVVNESSITIEWSATATDGCIAYRVSAGNQVIGCYGANCSVNYPIGVSQQASAGEIVQTAIPAVARTVSGGINGAAKGGAIGAVGGVAKNAIVGAYEVANVALTRHNSSIGGIGGGAGTGLSLDCKCFTVAHPTSLAPADMAATMGLPTMKPTALATLTGYCQCANAHVAANGAESQELDEIDAYLNSGFYIE